MLNTVRDPTAPRITTKLYFYLPKPNATSQSANDESDLETRPQRHETPESDEWGPPNNPPHDFFNSGQHTLVEHDQLDLNSRS